MKNNRKFISLISAMTLLVSAMPLTSTAISADDEKAVLKPINATFNRSSYTYLLNNVSDFDHNNSGDLDFGDYLAIREGINRIYKNYDYNNVIASYDTNTYHSFNVDGDNDIDVVDYCCLLSYFQNGFDFSIDGEEDYAIITDYNRINVTSVIVPSEVYVNGRIYPVMKISGNAFKKAESLESVTFLDYKQPEWKDKHNEDIGPNTYGDPITACTYLEIEDGLFDNCPNIATINLPDHVSFSKDAFKNSALADHYNYDDTNEEVCYFESDNGKIVACGAKGDYLSSTTLSIKEGTTSISNNAFNGYSLTTVSLPLSLKYIGSGAFSFCQYLDTVIHGYSPITTIKKYDKNIITRYLSSFDGTPLVCNSANAEMEKIANEIKAKIGYSGTGELTTAQQRQAIKEFGRYTYKNTYYRVYGHPALFPTDQYNSFDMDRGSVYNSSAAALLGSTECLGFSYYTSIVLDKVGVKNYSTGKAGHAFNIAYVDGNWYYIDMSVDGEREKQKIDGRTFTGRSDFEAYIDTKDFLLTMENGWHIAGRAEFPMYESSRNKQLSSGLLDFTSNFTPNKLCPTITLHYTLNDLTSDQYAILKGDIDTGIILLQS